MFCFNRAAAVMAVLMLSATGGFQAAVAADAEQGKALAAKCTTCHGPLGKGAGSMPNIAGMPPETFVAALNAYKAGERKHPMMASIAKTLSDADMANLAAFFATK